MPRISTKIVARLNNIPIDNAPQSLQMGGTTVLVVQVVGVFPNVKSKKRFQTFCQRISGILLLGDKEFTALIGREPHPAAPEKPHSFSLELSLEVFYAAPLPPDLTKKTAVRCRLHLTSATPTIVRNGLNGALELKEV